jgi:hypothetical protein
MSKFDKLYSAIVEKVIVKKKFPLDSKVLWVPFGTADAKLGVVVGYKNSEDTKDGYVLVKDDDGKEHKLIWSALKVKK